MKSIIGIVILGTLVGGVFVLNNLTKTQDGKSRLNVAGDLEVMVEMAQPERRSIVRTVQAPGDVEAIEEVDISSEVVAKIVAMPVDEGDYVRKGDLLCRLDDVDYRARVVSAEANVAKLKALRVQAQADLDFAERSYDEAQRVRESGAMGSVDFRNYQTSLVKARAMIEMRDKELIEAEALLDSARDDLAKTVITSPLDGIVSQRFADPGEVVITGTMNNLGTRIMVVTDLSKMQVRCRVDEADAPLVAPDQPARIYLQSDTRRSIPGRVLRVGTKGTKPLGRDVVTFETLVLITGNDPRVKPGMTANVEVEVARRDDALTIPVEAVVYRKRRDLPESLVKQYDEQRNLKDEAARQAAAEYLKVLYCVKDDKAYPHLIETGISDVSSVEIVAGLNADDTIVTGPYRSLDQLKEGSPVKKMEKPASAVPPVDESATSQPATSQPTEPPATTAPATSDDTKESATSAPAPAEAPAQ